MKPVEKIGKVLGRLPCALLCLFVCVNTANAALDTLDSRVIVDSEEEDFSRRVNSYDMGVDSSGDVHIVYSKPTTGDKADIIYVRRVSGVWSEQPLSTDGLRQSISTRLVIGADDMVHVCYIKETPRGLYYRKITDGTPGTESMVAMGGWHTRMQLDGSGRAAFIREDETFPALVSKLSLFTTTNETDWEKNVLNVPDTTRFRIGEFVYANGKYHVTYGDSAVTKDVLTGKGSTTRVPGTFHNFYYASSTNGVNWTSSLVDNSGTLYENEFWTTLAVDGATPLVAFYKYAEYGDKYNTGTSALLAEWNGSGWDKKNITVATYPETREGMGVNLVVRAPGDYLGGWDFSPDNTHNAFFRGERGNIALTRNGADDDWSEKLQIDPFSAEGEVKLRLISGRLHFLALGDFVDAKLYYREYDLDYIDEQFERLSTPFPWGLFLPAINRASGNQ